MGTYVVGFRPPCWFTHFCTPLSSRVYCCVFLFLTMHSQTVNIEEQSPVSFWCSLLRQFLQPAILHTCIVPTLHLCCDVLSGDLLCYLRVAVEVLLYPPTFCNVQHHTTVVFTTANVAQNHSLGRQHNRAAWWTVKHSSICAVARQLLPSSNRFNSSFWPSYIFL